MLITIGTVYFFYVLAKLYISYAEIGFVARARNLKAVVLSDENYQKAADYKIESEKLSVVSALYDYALFLCWLMFGLKMLENAVIKEGGVWESTAFVLIFIAINFVLTLPFSLYSTFIKERKFGFSTITPKTYLLDLIKSALAFLVIGGAIIALVAWIIDNLELWWLWSFAAVFAVILFINMLYPTLIAPLFNKFTPLENAELKGSIEALMSRAGLKSSGIFTMDASKRDNRLNAYFGGLGKSKRVVLFDTLIEKLNSSELLAVLGHELGHFKHKDILKNIASIAVLLFALFAIFGNLPLGVYEIFGVKKGAYSVIAIFLILSPIVSFIVLPIFGALSRKHEYAADRYGSLCESKEALACALVKLADENKIFPRSHPLYIAFNYTHPPLLERLKELGYEG